MGNTGLRQTEERRYTVGPGLPPTGNTRGHSLHNSNLMTGGRGGTAQGINDILGGGGGNYMNGYNVPAPKIATINVRVRGFHG